MGKNNNNYLISNKQDQCTSIFCVRSLRKEIKHLPVLFVRTIVSAQLNSVLVLFCHRFKIELAKTNAIVHMFLCLPEALPVVLLLSLMHFLSCTDSVLFSIHHFGTSMQNQMDMNVGQIPFAHFCTGRKIPHIYFIGRQSLSHASEIQSYKSLKMVVYLFTYKKIYSRSKTKILQN